MKIQVYTYATQQRLLMDHQLYTTLQHKQSTLWYQIPKTAAAVVVCDPGRIFYGGGPNQSDTISQATAVED